MNFWERVDNLIENLNLTRKELASKANFDVSIIGKGIKNNYLPNAETAVKIAKELKTTVEFLVTGQDAKISNKTTEELQILFQYSHTIHALNKIPPQSQEVIKAMIQNLSDSMEIERSIYEQQMKNNGKALSVAER